MARIRTSAETLENARAKTDGANRGTTNGPETPDPAPCAYLTQTNRPETYPTRVADDSGRENANTETQNLAHQETP